jgi:hypothetical protein
MEYQIPLARGNSGVCLRSKFAVVRLHSTGPISRGRWSSAGALRRCFAAVRFCLASPDMPLRPRWWGKSLVRTRCRVQFPGAAPIGPVSLAGDTAVLYTDDTAFDSPTGLQFRVLRSWQTSGPLGVHESSILSEPTNHGELIGQGPGFFAKERVSSRA